MLLILLYILGASETYKSRWFAYDAFSFLADRNKPRKRLNTVSH